MKTGFTDTLIQVSFPAAVQIIVFFIPVLYLVLDRNEEFARRLLKNRESLWPLLWVMMFSELLYVGNVALVVLRSDVLVRQQFWNNLTILDAVVIVALALFAFVPPVVFFDVWQRHKRVMDNVSVPTDEVMKELIVSIRTRGCPRANENDMQELAGTIAAAKKSCGDVVNWDNVDTFCDRRNTELRRIGLILVQDHLIAQPNARYPFDLRVAKKEFMGQRFQHFRKPLFEVCRLNRNGSTEIQNHVANVAVAYALVLAIEIIDEPEVVRR